MNKDEELLNMLYEMQSEEFRNFVSNFSGADKYEQYANAFTYIRENLYKNAPVLFQSLKEKQSPENIEKQGREFSRLLFSFGHICALEIYLDEEKLPTGRFAPGRENSYYWLSGLSHDYNVFASYFRRYTCREYNPEFAYRTLCSLWEGYYKPFLQNLDLYFESKGRLIPSSYHVISRIKTDDNGKDWKTIKRIYVTKDDLQIVNNQMVLPGWYINPDKLESKEEYKKLYDKIFANFSQEEKEAAYNRFLLKEYSVWEQITTKQIKERKIDLQNYKIKN